MPRAKEIEALLATHLARSPKTYSFGARSPSPRATALPDIGAIFAPRLLTPYHAPNPNTAKNLLAQVLKTRQRFWIWLLPSLLLHALIIAAFFIHFSSLGFKKGTSTNPHAKVAGFQILGGGELGEHSPLSSLAQPSAQSGGSKPKPLKETPLPTPSQNQAQAPAELDLSSLSLYNGRNGASNQANATNATKPKSRIKALAKFPGVDNITRRDIEELYGAEFGDYGLAEQEFLVNNLRNIGRITQRYLQYPPSAARLGQEGMSAVEFYLHPNGDISGLKILVSSSYMLLDRNSERTIEIAYKDYPRPTTKTKIRIFVNYGLVFYPY